MIRNYRLGNFESLDLTITDAGTSQIKLRYDGLEGCALANLELYSDSGRTTALSASDWEYYTEDVNKTLSEAGTGGTGDTIYKEIRVLNPTYQTGSIYATFDNFGTYPDGDVLGIDYISIDANYAYTTKRNLMTYLVCDGLSADITITVTDAGFDERSRFKVVNKDPTYKVIVQDGTELKPYWVVVGQSVDFYDVSDALVWASGGWETILQQSFNRYATDGSLLRGKPENGSLWNILLNNSAGTYPISGLFITVKNNSIVSYGPEYSGSSEIRYDGTADQFDTATATYGIIEVQLWHEAS